MSSASSPVHPGEVAVERRRLPLWSVALLAVVAGLAVGRFVTAGDDAPDVPTEAPAFQSDLDPEARIVSLEATVAVRPDDATTWRLLGTAYAQRGAEVGDAALYEKADAALTRAGELAPNDPTILVARGALALTLHQFDDAERLGEDATDALPANADALGVLVDAQVELGHYDDAAVTLQEMLDARPGLPALARTSYLRELHGDMDAAKAAMRQAAVAGAASTYDVATVTVILGDLHRRSGDLAAAGVAYEAALADAPDLLTAQVGAAWVRAATGDSTGAQADLEALVDDFPSPNAVLLLLDLQRAAGDDEAADASAELVRAIASLQEAAGQLVDLEMAIFEADEGTDPDRAVELARRAYDARPDNVFVADALGWALFRSGDAAAASPYVEQALRLGSTEPTLRFHAAEITLALGDEAAAARHLEIALVDPWSSFRHHDRLLELAGQLGVTPPAAP